MNHIMIREATMGDAAAIRAIYAPYVEATVITFEYTVPSVEEFQRRISPFLTDDRVFGKMFFGEFSDFRVPEKLAVEDGRVVGYAYAGPFVGRAAYDWAAELSIYVDIHGRKQGLGKKLYGALLDALKEMGVLDVYACIGLPEKADEYLDCNSAEFHAHLGFTPVGLFKQCGYKFGRWYNMIWMGLNLGAHRSPQPPVIPYPQLKKQ